jgi:hypothetical protein
LKKFIKILIVACLISPSLFIVFDSNDVYAAIEQRVSEAKNESKTTLTDAVKKMISNSSNQHISTVSQPLNNLYSYKTGNSRTYSEGDITWGKEAYVISMNPVYTTDGVDTNLLKIDYNRPGNGTTETSPSSISISAKTNKKIDTSFWLEVRSVYTVYHTLEWETFSGSTKKTLYSQDLLENPISIRVHVTKDNEEGSVRVSYTDVDSGTSIINDNTVFGKIGTNYDNDVKADYSSKKEYIEKQFYKYIGEKNTSGKYIDGTIQAEYQFERVQGGDTTVNFLNKETNLNERQKEAFGEPSSDTLKGKYGEVKTAEAKNIPHYETIDGKLNKEITLNEKPQTITFEYRLSSAKPLTVKYVDQDGAPIPGVDNKVISGRWGDDYVVTPREEIPFYTLIDSTDPIKGYLDEESKEIVYHYQVSEGGPIIVHYIDENGTKLKKDKTITGLKFGQKFNEKAEQIEHYHQKKDEISGQVTDKKQEITFVYTINDGKPVIANFKDQTGNIIHESYLLYGKYNSSFDVSDKNKEIESILKKLTNNHYELIKTTGNISGKFIDTESETYSGQVSYIFRKKKASGKVTVRYINSMNNKEISEPEILSGNFDDPYTSQPKIINNYHLTKIPEITTGKFSDDDTEIIYSYEPDVGGTVILNYLDKDTQKPIATNDVKSGGVNQPYQFNPKNIQHYQISSIPENAQGVYPDANKVVNVYFEYDRAPAKPIHVVYQDEEGNIFEEYELNTANKKWNDSFSTEIKSFKGYEVKNITIDGKEVKSGNGLYDDEKEQTVIYTYKLKKAAPIHVRYMDIETQKNILPQENILDPNAVFGDIFESKSKEIEGYIYLKAELNGVEKEGSDIISKYTDLEQNLIYYYSRDKTSLETKDSVIYEGDIWNPLDNFVKATDKDGNPVKFEEVGVTGNVDTQKAGVYEITYSYEGITSKAKVNVKEKQTALNVHDSTIYVGEKWTAKENFDSAMDKEGKPVKFEEVEITGNVDTQKAGVYEITYSYEGITSKAKVNVKEKQMALNVHDSTIYVGEKWAAKENFDSAMDKEGKPVKFEEVKVTGNVDTQKAGVYEITYSYEGITSKAKVNVKNVPQYVIYRNKESSKRIYPRTGEQKNHLISVVGVILLCVVLFKIENKRKENK